MTRRQFPDPDFGEHQILLDAGIVLVESLGRILDNLEADIPATVPQIAELRLLIKGLLEREPPCEPD